MIFTRNEEEGIGLGDWLSKGLVGKRRYNTDAWVKEGVEEKNYRESVSKRCFTLKKNLGSSKKFLEKS